TVINFTEPDFIATMAEICDRQGLQADAADLWRRFLRGAYLLRSENHHDPVYRRYDEAWAIQFEHVFRRLRLPGDAWAAALYLKERLAGAPAFDEAGPVIEALRPHYRLALLSNADDDFLTACLERNGLRFDIVVSSEQAGAIKPNPAIFLHLTERLGLRPEQVLYAGDNPIPDVLGPARAGMKVAWVNRAGLRRPRRVPPPDIRVRSLSELVAILVPRRD
ncbi:MAG TPA: HAD family hydrolase, partial [Dehalococcoidia bacterium]|nr:HAD family hydrolase [Dehalococcoidia bacterium]